MPRGDALEKLAREAVVHERELGEWRGRFARAAATPASTNAEHMARMQRFHDDQDAILARHLERLAEFPSPEGVERF